MNNLKHKSVTVGSKSINNLMLPKDFKAGICEYIWNGFDAGATTVEVSYKANELGGVDSIFIKDNGSGIDSENLDQTFGKILESLKKKSSSDLIHGHRGKGRFSFIKFADFIRWDTIYKSNDVNKKYYIETSSDKANDLGISNIENTEEETGTIVTISNVKDLMKENLEDFNFINYINKTFQWYLYLNKEKGFKIIINGKELDYMESIDETLSSTEDIKIEDFEFKIYFIKWIGKIKEKYYSFFLSENNELVHKETTSFNKSGIEFPHTVYVKSKYFENFTVVNNSKKISEGQESIFKTNNNKDKIFKELLRKIKSIIEKKQNIFLKKQAPEFIKKLKSEGAFPKFENNKYGLLKEKDLEMVLTEVCAIQPQLFKTKNSIQNKTIVEFLNLLLDSDERGGIINIMDNILNLTPDERKNLNKVLEKTTLSKIVRTVSIIQNRLKVIEILKVLIYDQTNFTNERDHIQKIIEENYWLFGEQYNLVSADKNFEKLIENYSYLIDGLSEKEFNKIEKENKLDPSKRYRRPDIFICRSRSVQYENSTEGEEHIIVELKAPSVTLNKKIYRQVEDYMETITELQLFNSKLRKWKFIMISNKVDDYILKEYETWKEKGKNCLVKQLGNYEIYAMTWDDVFKSFEINNRYLLQRLEFDKSLLAEEVKEISDKSGREFVNDLTNEILDLKEKFNAV
ncbi:ATP-binding protein [Clostridium perfringens]|uniref:ATP-binding protein n=2 Tax=Clostridium perfringens TaxID=1502 RepID=UPI000D70BD75|nr:ATP-binding protein [Clostridium perfringens]EGT4142189.1 ATP-binding protein [Clostridium perfringens]MBI5985905.1 ATP-binding protein [Clostridium perfringens]MBI6016984.1 ATP-binding protein [Clostridium perfringens]MBO3407874.1 ATP-binding protein [Clostridium perfringens]MBO3430492.1 ATP-binding protein [Clostridium perfringens]